MQIMTRIIFTIFIAGFHFAYAGNNEPTPASTKKGEAGADTVVTEGEAIDPSDLTRVYTMVSAWVNSQSNLRATASWAGAWSETQQFMGFVEGYWGDEDDTDQWGTDLLKVRAQYFHVIDTEMKAAPKLGFSLDYIDNPGDNNLAALGVLSMIPPSVTGRLQVFPNVAYMQGKAAGVDVDGYMLNLYGTYPVGTNGTFIQVWPEYISVSGAGVDSTSLTFSGLYAQPLNSLRTMWMNIRLDYATKETRLNSYFERINEDETVLTLGFKFYL